MKITLVVLAALWLTLFSLALPATAGGDQDKSVYGNYPAELHEINPVGPELKLARQKLETAIRQFWDIYANQPWNYWRVVTAYYAYADAYHIYVWTLRRYWDWEHTHHRFSGRVLTRDVQFPGLTEGREPTAADLKALPREVSVPNATVTLSQNLAFLEGQPLAKVEDVKGAEAEGANLSIARPQSVWTARSDDRGRFDFVGIPRGAYHYRVVADGFFPAQGLVEIGANRQERDIHLNRHRIFQGQVFTVTRDCVPFLRPLMAKAGGATADVASADEVEKILGSDQRILPQFRRLIPADGARVTLSSNLATVTPIPGGPVPFPPPGQLPTQLPGQLPTQTPGQLPTQTPVSSRRSFGQMPTQTPGQLPTQTPGQLPPIPTDKLPDADKGRPITIEPAPATTTGADGRFRFVDLSQTSYRVTVEKPGYLPFNALITLERASTTRRIVIFPFVPFEPGKLDPLQAQPGEATGSTLNDPFAK